MFTHRPATTMLIAGLILSAPALAVKGDTEAAAQGWSLLEQGALLVDVRSPEEFEAGHIEGAVNVNYTEVEALVELLGPDPGRPAVLYCGSGRRAGIAQEALEARGYTAIFNASGYEALQATRP